MTKKNKRFEYNYAHAAVAFVIAAILYIIFIAANGIVPFGNNTWLINEMNSQYADYYAYLRSIAFGDNSIFYTFDGTLGRSMIGFCAYYLTSPFLFLLLLFPAGELPLAFTCIAGIKLSLCAFTFDLLLQRLCTKSTYLCSVTYALCGYMLSNVPNLMWLDVLIVLPVAMIALESLLEDGKMLGYTICTALIIYLNYFMGYMTFVFLLLWAIVRLLSTADKNPQEAIMRWGVATAAGIGIDAFVLLPAVLELKDISLTYDVKSTPPDMSLLYLGIPVSVCALLYFLCKKIPIRERIAMLVFLAVLVVSYLWDGADIIWHALFESGEGSLPEAFAFIVVILVCAGRFIQESEWGAGRRTITLIVGLSAVILQLGEWGYRSYSFYESKAVDAQKADSYAESINKIGAAVDSVKQKDYSLFRMDSWTPGGKNDGMMHDYRSISYSGTSELAYSRDFLGRMGYDAGRLYVDYGHDNTETADSILGVKYVMTDRSHGYRMHKDYSLVKDGDVQVYINPYALPPAIGVYREMSGESSDPFSMQEDIYGRLVGEPVEIFIPADVKYIETDNSRPVREYRVTASGTGELYFYMSDMMYDESRLEIYVNDEYIGLYGKDISQKVLNLGQYKKGDFLLVHVIASDASEFGTATFVTEDTAALKQAYDKLAGRRATVGQLDSANIFMTVDSAYTVGDDISGEVGVFTTIPYQKGWKAKVSGVKVEPVEVYDALIYIPVTEALQQTELGPDEDIRIELKYVPEGFYLGLIVSFSAVIIIILMAIIKNSEAGFFGDDYEQEEFDQ